MHARRGKTALILAGGGTMGAAYEIGVLSALERALRPDFSTTRFDIYVGISAGAIIAALAANRLNPHLLFRAIANNEQRVFNWRRRDIYRLDLHEILCCSLRAVGNFFRILKHYRERGWGIRLSDLFYIIQEQYPSGIFSLEPMQDYLCQAFRTERLLDDFNLIQPELYIPAYDLDLGERVVFGSEGFRDMHICQAITASCAIPHFFRPHQIGAHHYVDGSTGRSVHLDIAIERGADLIVLVNPRVPLRNDPEHFCLPALSYGQCASVAELGISIAQEQARRPDPRPLPRIAPQGRYRADRTGARRIGVLLPEPDEHAGAQPDHGLRLSANPLPAAYTFRRTEPDLRPPRHPPEQRPPRCTAAGRGRALSRTTP